MSLLDDDRFEWRDTYFVWFTSARRPKLAEVERALSRAPGRLKPADGVADENGRLESLTVYSPEDHSALEIRFASGGAVSEEARSLAGTMRPSDDLDSARLDDLKRANARFDVSHFEDMAVEGIVEGIDEDFDPSALMTVLDTLVGLTDGVAVDPQSGILI